MLTDTTPYLLNLPFQSLVTQELHCGSARVCVCVCSAFRTYLEELPRIYKEGACTWCVQVRRSPKEAFAAAMQSWRERCEKCVCVQGDYFEK